MVADIRLERVAASTAFNPKRAMSERRLGAKEPSPPSKNCNGRQIGKSTQCKRNNRLGLFGDDDRRCFAQVWGKIQIRNKLIHDQLLAYERARHQSIAPWDSNDKSQGSKEVPPKSFQASVQENQTTLPLHQTSH